MSSSISLTNAVTSGDENAVTALLANGADVNERTGGGQTALILAVIFGHTKLVKLLVKAGADPQVRDNLGLNAIEWAKRRGSTEALEILTNAPRAGAPRRKIEVKIEEPEKSVAKPPPTAPDVEPRQSVSDEEKSRRWLAGLRQRLDEQEARHQKRKEFHPEPAQPEVPAAETIKPPEPEKPKPAINVQPAPARIFEALADTSRPTGNRKRCPQCNAIYNGDLVSYCAHHIVPLVDIDEPVITDAPKSSVPLFWIMVVITLSGSIVIGSLITTYLYNSNQAAARSAAPQQPNIQKGFPEVGGNLAGKAVLLPEAECPLGGSEPVSGTVVVRIMVDKKGQVYWARGSGGDWLMRGASTEAAMKSTFSPEKLRGRTTEGTITYTFQPQ